MKVFDSLFQSFHLYPSRRTAPLPLTQIMDAAGSVLSFKWSSHRQGGLRVDVSPEFHRPILRYRRTPLVRGRAAPPTPLSRNSETGMARAPRLLLAPEFRIPPGLAGPSCDGFVSGRLQTCTKSFRAVQSSEQVQSSSHMSMEHCRDCPPAVKHTLLLIGKAMLGHVPQLHRARVLHLKPSYHIIQVS